MALITCNNCGQMISDKAKTCPKCGVPIKTERGDAAINSAQIQSQINNQDHLNQKKKTSPAIITTIVLLSLAVLALGGYALYKMNSEKSLLADEQQEVTAQIAVDEAETVQLLQQALNEKDYEKATIHANKLYDAWSNSDSNDTTIVARLIFLSHSYFGISYFDKINDNEEAAYRSKALAKKAFLKNKEYARKLVKQTDANYKLMIAVYVDDQDDEVAHEQSSATIKEPVDVAADGYTSSDNAWLAQRYATNEDIAGLSSDEIRIMRNSIFARHGRYFKDPVLQEYFNSQSWYHPYRKEVPTQELNDYERKNIDFLKKHE